MASETRHVLPCLQAFHMGGMVPAITRLWQSGVKFVEARAWVEKSIVMDDLYVFNIWSRIQERRKDEER
ncbi:hypothetical protein WME99_21230 [Sorangium sp. So ce136]|uniref:hypothetical protein n=1 Tax=Sorangium sp. So ce136 TaxID=3133284 RepID=UPI003F11D1BA